ncbi:MAG TPA: LytTR family DNA-binding domain-containing protein [Gemmatimonadaceae bacterium]|nr:LytTR family DNA-binding domain-containing protein [Gemmatimonadaceae bacterium]
MPEPTAPARLRVLIVDDEPLARDCVRLALASHADVEIVRECESGEEAVAAILDLAPDLVFLDVQMPDLGGFDVVEQIGPERMPPVIFVTAFDAHALAAFRIHALDYVLKPFDDARVDEALDHARSHLARQRDGELGRRLSALLGDRVPPPTAVAPMTPTPYLTRFGVRHEDRTRFIPAAAVDWIEAENNYVRLHVGSAEHRLRTAISVLARALDPRQFAQIHRSTIVNLDRVREVQPWFGGDYVAILHDGRQLRVSRTFAPKVLRPLQ